MYFLPEGFITYLNCDPLCIYYCHQRILSVFLHFVQNYVLNIVNVTLVLAIRESKQCFPFRQKEEKGKWLYIATKRQGTSHIMKPLQTATGWIISYRNSVFPPKTAGNTIVVPRPGPWFYKPEWALDIACINSMSDSCKVWRLWVTFWEMLPAVSKMFIVKSFSQRQSKMISTLPTFKNLIISTVIHPSQAVSPFWPPLAFHLFSRLLSVSAGCTLRRGQHLR